MMYWSVGSIYTLSLHMLSYSRLNNARDDVNICEKEISQTSQDNL